MKDAETTAHAGSAHPKAKKRDILTVVYLLLRTGANKDELCDFFSVVNSGFQLDNRESSSAIVLGKHIDGLHSIKHRDAIYKNMEYTLMAFDDFVKGVSRRKQYTIKDTSRARALLDQVREMDGLTL